MWYAQTIKSGSHSRARIAAVPGMLDMYSKDPTRSSNVQVGAERGLLDADMTKLGEASLSFCTRRYMLARTPQLMR